MIGGKVIGFACCQKSRDEDMINAGEIVAVYILKEYQGRGIGKLLMDVCYKELKEYKRIILWVLEDNKLSVGFYKSQGFKPDGKKMSFYEKILVRMMKDN